MNRIAAVAFASVLASAAQADQNSAFQDAKSFAGGKTQGVFTGISSGAVADKIPGYGANPSETQFFQGGQGALSGPGVTKMQNCASYAPGQNKIANQECEAVNFLARNPEVRPQFNIGSNDPIVISAKEARKNAESFFQTLDINGGAEGSTQCTTKTTTTPAQYTTETCTSLRAVEGQQCTMGRKVDIDADANYQCDKTLTAFTSQERQPVVSTSSCTYGRQVNIDADSNFQCDKTLTAFTSQERQPVVSTSSCTYGRQVNIDEDSRFQCDQTVSSYETVACDIQWSATVHEVHELKKGQSCVTWAGYGQPGASYTCPLSGYGFPETNQATSYLDQGYNQIWVNGTKVGVYTEWQRNNCWIKSQAYGRGGCEVSATVGNGGGNYGNSRGILTIWKDGGGYVTPGSDSCSPSSLNKVGYGVGMSLCKSSCASYTKTWVCGGYGSNEQCNWSYVCNNTGSTNSCPSGWDDLGTSCRDGRYSQLLGEGCFIVSSISNQINTNDTIHYFACAQQSNECASFEARAQ